MEQKKVVYRFQQTDNVHEIFIFDEIRKIGPFNWDTWQYDCLLYTSALPTT